MPTAQPSFQIIDHPIYKYRLTNAFIHQMTQEPPHGAVIQDRQQNNVATLRGSRLVIAAGYAWDGASGPALDTMRFIRASLVHDVLYQMGLQAEDRAEWKLIADRELLAIAEQDGMPWWRRKWVYRAVRWFGRIRIPYRG